MSALVVFLGDLHVGSTVALCPDNFTLSDGQPLSASVSQRWLFCNWQNFIERVKAHARGREVVLVLGGDLIDGPRHHGTFQSWGTGQEQVAGTVALLLPLVTLANKRIYGLRGTPCHGGLSGADDDAVVRELGGKSDYRWELEIEGVVFDVAHHGRRDSRPWTAGNAGLTEIRKANYRVGRRPDYIIRHHVHQKAEPVTLYGITYATCPSWQLQTEHGRRIDPANVDPVGGLLWTKESGLTQVLYEPSPDPLTVVPLSPSEY